MKYILHVEGMKCERCKARTGSALSAADGVKSVSVSLAKKEAAVTFADGAVPDGAALKKAVEDLGFTVTGIEEKKGLFGR